ncbi:Chaperone DnaJ [Trema orientale]|uniref:Chaperone DnaJ n=1 Tax=Trema orientale TaxID=63057 RepID=A0A2P5F9Z3_TREOI|nr:Chaperone DnaJ [Trema orientale]
MNSGVPCFRSCNSHNIRVDHDHDRDDQTSTVTRAGNIYKHRSADNYLFPSSYTSNSPLSRKSSKRSATPINVNPTTPTPLFISMSRKSWDSSRPSPAASVDGRKSSLGSSTPSPHFVGRVPSSRQSSLNNPIMFSNSSGTLKPPPIEKKLECTLEELCYGCQKKIKITRDVVKDTGGIVREEELLTIKVKPGWKKGTKITFEGMGNEKPGSNPADVIFVIAEKRHQLFRREGDDLEFAVRIPLVKALTGCDLSIPLLGGEIMSLTVDDVIYPGFEKIVPEKGMPNTKHRGKRGDLRVTFLVDFPTRLTDEQRLDVLSILQDQS